MSAGGFFTSGIDLGDGVGLVDGAIANTTVDTTSLRYVTITVSKGSNGVFTPQAASFTKYRG